MRQPPTPPDLDDAERFVVTVLEIADAFYRTVSSLIEGFDELEDNPFPGEGPP